MTDTHNSSIVRAPKSVTRTAVTASASAAVALDSGNRAQGWYTFAAYQCDVFILFGNSSIADPTTSTGWPIPMGQERSWLFRGGLDETHYKVITSTGASGAVYATKS